MADIYPRKGRILLSEAKSMLSNDEVFGVLSEADQLIHINNAAQEVCNFRNKLEKEDYNADNVGDPELLTSTTSSVYVVTTAERTALGLTLGPGDAGYLVYDSDDQSIYVWSGTAWV